ncbi:MAG: hypothetical protein CME61_06830 [Halobacteriovoraceae bacterium]|nr:hypothetical protein [Halobacteriovoraceae bacterium]
MSNSATQGQSSSTPKRRKPLNFVNPNQFVRPGVSPEQPRSTNPVGDPIRFEHREALEEALGPNNDNVNNDLQIETDPMVVREKELARYFKCHSRMARIRPADDSSFAQELEAIEDIELLKEKSIEGCAELLESASLTQSGSGWELNGQTQEGMSVLKTFNDLHTSWLKNLGRGFNADFHETAEPALRNTLALFAEDFSHKDVLEGNRYLTGMRTKGVFQPSQTNQIYNLSNYPSSLTTSGTGLSGNLTLYGFSHSINVYPSEEDSTFTWDVELVKNLGSLSLSENFSSGHGFPNLNSSSGANESPESLTSSSQVSFSGRINVPLITDNDLFSSFDYSISGVLGAGKYLISSDISGHRNRDLGLRSDINFTDNTNQCEPELIERGYLYGIKYQPSPGSCTFPGTHYGSPVRKDTPFDFYYHSGGGAIGGIQYILHNHDSTDLGTMPVQEHKGNGTFSRLLAYNIIEDFLCRELPVALNIDNLPEEIAPKSEEDIYSDHSYRLNGVCMKCHATIDYISAAYRNISISKMGKDKFYTNSSFDKNNDPEITDPESLLILGYSTAKTPITSPSIMHNYEFDHNSTHEDYIGNHDPTANGGTGGTNLAQYMRNNNYISYDPMDLYAPSSGGKHKKYWSYSKPYSRLFMHDLNGALVNEEVVGIEELAAALRETIDFSACYAKRYFEFLTGDTIVFFPDIQNGSKVDNPFRYNGELTVDQLEKFEYVRGLGQELKDGDINLQGLILKIIGSDYFLESIYGKDISKNESVETISYSSVDSIYNSFGKCISCHKEGNQNFLSEYNSEGIPCVNKKIILDNLRDTSYQINGDSTSLNKPLVTKNSVCDSTLYLNLFASSDECGQTEPPNALDKWMNAYGSEWNEVDDQNIKDFINDNYSCED